MTAKAIWRKSFVGPYGAFQSPYFSTQAPLGDILWVVGFENLCLLFGSSPAAALGVLWDFSFLDLSFPICERERTLQAGRRGLLGGVSKPEPASLRAASI